MVWYTLQLHGAKVVALLDGHQAAALRDRGFALEPASQPAGLADLIGRALASLARLGALQR